LSADSQEIMPIMHNEFFILRGLHSHDDCSGEPIEAHGSGRAPSRYA